MWWEMGKVSEGRGPEARSAARTSVWKLKDSLSPEPWRLYLASNMDWGDKDWDSLVCRSRLGETTNEVSTIQPL